MTLGEGSDVDRRASDVLHKTVTRIFDQGTAVLDVHVLFLNDVVFGCFDGLLNSVTTAVRVHLD